MSTKRNQSRPSEAKRNQAVRISLKRTSKNVTVGPVEEPKPSERAQLKQLYGFEEDKMYEPRDICKKLRISIDLFRRLCRGGYLRYLVLADKRVWRVPGCELIKFLQNSLR